MKKLNLFFAICFVMLLAAVVVGQDQYPPEAPDMPEWLLTLVGVAAPLVIQLVNKYVPTKAGRFWVAVGLSILVALVAALAMGAFPNTPEQAVIFVTWVFAFSQVAYALFWKKLLEGPMNLKALSK